jgi:hypothetical protein
MSKNNLTFVTGIWDLNRSEAQPGWNRSFDHYVSCFKDLLVKMKDHNLCIFIDPDLEDMVWEYRDRKNTVVNHHRKENFSGSFFPFFDKIQQIRTNPDWYNQVGWLKDSTQGSLEYYNPMVMSKMFLLHNAKILNPFNDDYFFWIDGGLSNTVSIDYLNNISVIENLKKLANKILFICFPYETQTEIHGFDIRAMRKYSKSSEVNRVARGGFFGGHKDYLSDANTDYYQLLDSSLNENLMGTEESIFTIMTYLDPLKYKFEMIEDNGLIYRFFEDIKKPNYKSKNFKDVNLYIITYNAPDQVESLIESFKKYEPKYLTESKLILINNTIDTKYDERYNALCKEYNIEQHKFDNIGICGGRQFAAEHFEESNADYMLFFEDDMFIDLEGHCSFGLSKFVDDLYMNTLDIIEKEKYSFLKLCFTEFFGDNSEQWSWHNVNNADKKKELFGEINERPKTVFRHIKNYNGVPYAEGEIYYSNWPHLMSREGNKKCFLDTKWNHPYEQTWMSHIFQLTRLKQVNPGILLASPITHSRTTHYAKEERREN